MRRAQIDGREYPVRNLSTNPAFRTSASTAIMRTNLITYPNFETTGSNTTIRTNLCTNPRGIYALPAYQGETNQTIAQNVAITGHPEGLTTANRVSYTTGVNPGVAIMTSAVSGTQYTLSAWIYHETAPTSGSQGIAQAGVASMTPAPAIVAGQWQRVSWTHTASGTSHYGFRVSSQGSAGSFLITGILVEARPDVGAFFDAETPIVNLCSNPSFTTGTLGYTSIGAALTRVTNQGGDGAVGELTQTGNPGTRHGAVYLHGSMFPAGTYTVSFDFKTSVAEHATLRSFCYNSVTALVTSGSPNLTAIKDGEFHRYTFTLTATDQFDRIYMEALGTGIPNGAKAWIDRILIERGTSTNSYYEGQGDFTYEWAGLANASTSLQRAQSIPGWAHLGNTYLSPSNAYSMSKGGAVKTRGLNGDGIWPADMTIVPNTTYTFSTMIKTTSVHDLTMGWRWKDSAGVSIGVPDTNVTINAAQMVTGEWSRISGTVTSPAGATRVQLMLRIYAVHTPTVFYIDEAIVTDSMTAIPYFDGGTTDTADYIYDWTGAGHITSSVMKYNVVPGSVASRNSGAYPDSKIFCIQSTAEDGAKNAKWITPALQGSSGWRVAGINTQGFDWSKIKAGKQYTLFMRYRSSGWATAQGVAFKISWGSGINDVITFEAGNLWPPLNANGWQEYRRTFTAMRDGDATQMLYIALPAVHSATTDGIFELREWGLFEEGYTGDYFDGTTAFSRWEGTANASTSIGWEPNLLDLAGEPILDYTAPGLYTLDDSFGPTEGRSFYTVFEGFAENMGPVSPILQYGDTALHDSVPNTYIQLRQDLNSSVPNGSNNLFLRRTGAMGVGYTVKTYSRFVIAWGLNDEGRLFMGGNGSTRLTDTQVMSLLHQRLLISSDQPLNKHIRTIAYRGVHDSNMALSVSRYLGFKYGANVA